MTELLAHTVAPSSLTTGSAPLLAIRDLSVEFGPTDRPVRVVDGLDLDVAAGETFALVGESGSGKSITAAAVLGVLPGGARIASGRIALDGDDLVDGGRRTKVRFQGSRIGMVFQNPMASLDPSFKIGNQLHREIIALHRPATSRRRRDEFAEAWLRNVGIADTARVLGSYPHELSGGMRQRVMIALAALSEPALLIADEPTTALDAVIQKQILDLLVSVTDRTGSALLLITHDFGVVSHVARKVAVMKDGRIVERGERARVLSAPADPYTASLIGSVPELGARTRLEDSGLPRRLGVLDATTPAAVPVPVPTGHVECSVLVELDSVSKEFVVGGIGTGQPKRRFLAVDDVSLTIRRGEVFGLIGESGSGKSTLARLIGGLQPVTSGGVTFDGHRIDELSKSEVRRLRPRFQYVFQDATSSLNPRVRVGEQVARPLVRFGKVDSRRAAEQRVSEVLELVGLPRAYADRYPHELSGGQRQRIGVARALALEPELLILDEPTSALDVSTQATILNLLLDLRDQLELTYLFIAHNLALVEFLCDRVGVLQDGRLLETFVTADLTTADRHHVTRGLLEAVLPIHRTDDPTPRSTP